MSEYKTLASIRLREQCCLPIGLAFLLVLSACGGSLIASSPAPTPTPTPATSDERADAMLAQMTQAEKLQMVEGGVTTNSSSGYSVPLGAAGWVPGVQRLGIPDLIFADGSVGVGNSVGPRPRCLRRSQARPVGTWAKPPNMAP